MQSDNWKTIDAIVADALELPEEEREAYLNSRKDHDPALCAQAIALLAGETSAERLFKENTATIQDTDDPLLGTTIDRYRVEWRIGRGGMGAVYLVRRVDGAYEQHAALKVIHAWLSTADRQRRFFVERQILATLDHPNIARLLDGGTTKEGMPYLVIEYVDGQPIDHYCNEHDLTVTETITLFLGICDAVAAAHRNLIVHRDLKPGNILVTSDGVPKLLDFGIAKLLDSSMELTRTGQLPMSPAYASPEQVRGEPITTGCDVYALGVVLYQLLTGCLPRVHTAASLQAMARGLSTDPKKPSTQCAAPKEVRTRLQGDLDAIILKALRDDPKQRYTSVEEFAADLRRYLAGLPVLARQHTIGYRAARFFRRHKTATTTAIVASILAVGSVAVFVQQHRRVVYQRDRAEAMVEFSAGLLDTDQIAWTLDNERSPATTFWMNLASSDDELSDDVLVRRDQLALRARTYLTFGRFALAEEYTQQSIQLNQALPERDRVDQRSLVNDLAAIWTTAGRYVDAESLLKASLDAARDGDDLLERAKSHTLAALCSWCRQDKDDTEQHLQQALQLTRGALGSGDLRTLELRALKSLVDESWDPGSDASTARLHHALAELTANGNGSLLAWPVIRALAETHERRGELRKAIAVYNERDNIPKELHTWAYPPTALGTGRLHLVRGEFSAAAQSMNEGVNASTQTRWQDELLLVSTLYQMAIGDLAAATTDAALLSAFSERRARLGYSTNTEERTLNLYHRAAIKLHEGETEEAQQFAERAYLAFSNGHSAITSIAMFSLAEGAATHYRLGEVESAICLATKIVNEWEAKGARWNPGYIQSLQLLAEECVASGNLIEAERALARARLVIEAQYSIDPSPRINEQLATHHRIQGDIRQQQGDREGAESSWTRAVAILQQNPEGSVGAAHHLIAGTLQLRLGNADLAVPHASHLFAQGWRHPDWVSTHAK